jgi:hypothetical protein
MSGLIEIGHAIIACPSCGTPRHVPVAALCVPFADATTKTFRALLRGEQVGEIHVQIKNMPDRHTCGTQQPKPTPPLRIVEGDTRA